MFKALFLALFLLSFFASVHADFFLVSPLEQKLLNNGVVELGEVSSGETFEIIISNESALGQDVRWDRALVKLGALPSEWRVENSKAGEKRLVVKVSVPKSVPSNIYQLKVTALNNGFGLAEEFTARVRVKEGLLSAAVNNPGLNQFPQVGEKVVYNIVLRNDSIALQNVKVFSTLSKNWFEEIEIEVPPKETVQADFSVVPRVAGRKDFKINVVSNITQKEVASFNSSLGVRPTLFGKLSAPVRGLPFFSFSFSAFYLFNSLVFSVFE